MQIREGAFHVKTRFLDICGKLFSGIRNEDFFLVLIVKAWKKEVLGTIFPELLIIL